MGSRKQRRETGRQARPPLDRLAGSSNSTVEALDPLIHQRTRLGIVSALAAAGGWMTFGEIKRVLGATDGNVSVHARKLEEAGYVACRKSFERRRPKTEFKLTAAGRSTLDRYLAHMEAVIARARGGDRS